MKRDVTLYIIEILVTVGIIFCSVPMWKDFADKQTAIEKTMAVSGLELSESEENNENLLISNGASFDYNTYHISNNSNYNVSGRLYLKYAKKSLLDYNYLLININNKVLDLKYLFQYEDENYYYFLLDTYNLNGSENKSYRISYTTKDEYKEASAGKGFIYHLFIDTSKNI